MADPITAEQVARAIEAARSDEGGISDALGGWQWDKRAPDYVRVAWGKPSLPDFIAALTRWHAELVAAETPRKAPDDTAPERLRERREALGLSMAEAATAVTALGFGEWDETSIHYCESPRALLTVRQLDLDRYAAALSAEEARRAKMAAERDAHAVPRLDWLEPASPPAHEVVDVPPEPWHARLVRLAQVAQDTSKACAEAEAAFKVADAERERTRLARAAARDACHAARKALTEATTAAAIVEAAQQPASVQPTRPEPRYKVGDWVRVQHHGTVYQIGEVADPFGLGTLYFREKPGPGCTGQSWAAVALTPALDPALRETARKTIAWMRGGSPLVGHYERLPGYEVWKADPDVIAANGRWASQLEALLGEEVGHG